MDADRLMVGDLACEKIITHAKIMHLASIEDTFNENFVKLWNEDTKWKIFIIGYPCEAGHKNLAEGR